MSNGNGNLKQIAYQESGNFVRQQESLLFQRLNYFLVAIAFLVAGFVELAASSIQHGANPLLMGLTVLVGFTGFLISWVFTAINYFNGQTIDWAYCFLERLEKKLLDGASDFSETELPYGTIRKEMDESGKGRFNLKTIAYDSIVESNPLKYIHPKEIKRAPHTWVIPFCFILFWLTALSIYCSFVFHWWTPFLVGIPVLYFIGVFTVDRCRAKGRSSMATKETAQKSASDVSTLADYIAKALTLDYPPQYLKVILDVPMKQLEEELQTLKAYVAALK